MIARITAILLVFSLLLQIGSQAFTLGWFVLDNQSFTEKYCQNWELEAPMCFGACKITDTFVQAKSTKDQLAPTKPQLRKLSYYPLTFRARPLDAKKVIRQGKNTQPTYTNKNYGRDYVGSVFWPPAT